MGIRNTSYYGWNTIETFHPVSPGLVSASYTGITSDSSGTLYACGWASISSSFFTGSAFIRRSKNDGKTWDTVYSTSSAGTGVGHINNKALSIGVSQNDIIYCITHFWLPSNASFVISSSDHGATWGQQGVFINDVTSPFTDTKPGLAFNTASMVFVTETAQRVYSSSDNGSTWGSQGVFDAPDDAFASGIAVAPNQTVYIVGGGGGAPLEILKSTNHGVTWTNVQPSPITNNPYLLDVVVDSQNRVFVAAISSSVADDSTNNCTILSSSDAGTSWRSASIDSGLGPHIPYAIRVDSKDNIYVFGLTGSNRDSENTKWYATRSPGFGKNWNNKSIDIFDSARALGAFIDTKDNIYVVGRRSSKAIIRKGSLTANSASIGPRMLNSSFGYVIEEFSGSAIEKFRLNNISEFPHSSGLYQMKNIVLGTTTRGKAGRSDDSIIQISHIGSFVKVLWPRADADIEVRGIGESIGQKAGSLATDWQPGDFIDVSSGSFDSLSLHCYVLVGISGTSDDALIKIETRPLRDLSFTIDQTIEQTISSSLATEKIYRDDIHRKTIKIGRAHV